ncbi:hypothetical protein [Pseudalkalibacillus salsuginis]|uniref:hypothetical protein n=1 Tax=Pseudalkalibacillus salsuginis TaxID=2910972 RepID=UPI001F203EB9|nr:hypothetical protein [Pseudalkalibacillus salsuginis]MCF6409506.1 hypothetical protein [Pseudalkalibacillus salsuginis]
MDFQEMLNWAFERHLNPLSWYIRPVFLIILVYFAYIRRMKGVILTFVLMMSSMFWFPAPEKINPQMEKVLEYEQMLLSNPVTFALTIAFMMVFVVSILIAFWKKSIKLGLVILNVTLIGKVLLALLFTGEDGWAPLGNTVFGLILINGIGFFILRMKGKKIVKEI